MKLGNGRETCWQAHPLHAHSCPNSERQPLRCSLQCQLKGTLSTHSLNVNMLFRYRLSFVTIVWVLLSATSNCAKVLTIPKHTKYMPPKRNICDFFLENDKAQWGAASRLVFGCLQTTAAFSSQAQRHSRK